MRKFVGSSLFIGAAAAGAIALSASAASAATWTVTNGNAYGHFSVGLNSGSKVTFTDTNTGSVFTCTTSTINGSAPARTSGSNPIATISGGSFTSCSGPLGSTGSATLAGGKLNGVTYNAATDTVTGNITEVSASLTINSILGTCTGTVTGAIGTTDGTANTANGNDTYANATGILTINPDAAPRFLKVLSTSGSCAGLINANDTVTFGAIYHVTDPVPPITARTP